MRSHQGIVLTAVVMGLVAGSPARLAAQDNATCLMCHSSASMFQGLEDPERLVVGEEEFSGSVHGALGLSCIMCHQDLAGSEFPHETEVRSPDCGACHSAVTQTYAESLHGYAWTRGNPRAPTCASCHGSHEILAASDPRSRTHKVRLPTTCTECHGVAGLLTDQIVKLPSSYEAYAASVHGTSNRRGIAAAATCADCHGVHDLKSPNEPTSKINVENVSATCGQCHPDVQLEYEASIHGRALAAHVHDSPTCTDCHGEHQILRHDDPEARTYAGQVATETCGECHDDPIIIAKYSMQGGVVGSYVDSYHGWATRWDDLEAATCVSCHTAHSVLPASDSSSAIHPSNVTATCAACHPNADERFAASYSHESASITANPINRIIRYIYLWAIALIIGAMVLHNMLIMNYFMVERHREEKESTFVKRFDKTQIFQHLLTTIAFVALAITGFALRFPDAWWVQRLVDLGLTEGARGDLHRIFAVMMIITAIYHMWYVFLTKRGLRDFKAMWPSWVDFKEFFGAIAFYTWRRRARVKFGRYDYMQKAEYWALVWGTLVMIMTGLILWFPAESVRLFPSWIVPAAQTIHYYEAWLATLAIIVWHFFFVIFHPEEYPMSWTWITGKMSEEAAKKHHGRWYEEVADSTHEE